MTDQGGGRSFPPSESDELLRAVTNAPARVPVSHRGVVSKRFTMRRRLGEGGMGVVYEAFDEERRASVALKTLNRFDAGALARFKREFRALQGLAHPNLVALDELFVENDQWFFTMELLDGVDFVSHVRGEPSRVAFESTVRESASKLRAHAAIDRDTKPGTSFDEARLRDGLRQLLDGVAALHAVDKVHRDIKPSNVLVTREGRVVLLDFGLVTEASVEDRSTGSAVVGTPAYMAPEQAASRNVGTAADLYAVGVMLYEALTGRLPIEGPHLQVLLEKQRREPAPPSTVASGIPADLDALCVQLLRFDPALRPSIADAQRALSVPRASQSVLPRTSTETPIFVGRGAELSELRAAFDVTAKGGLATVLVLGESGIGKSYLVRRFTGQLMAEHPEAMLLEGRCYERETVPYKTLDGIVDALSRRLSRMAPRDVERLLPTRSAMLAHVFPMMLRIPQVAKEHAALTMAVEPHEQRQRAFAALRDLFTRVAVRTPTVLVIDDLQWADDDGLRALAEILRGPEAPPLLLLGTLRVASSGEEASLTRVREVVPVDWRTIALASLVQEDARALAASFLRRNDAIDADPEIIAREAGGHPLFVEELVRHVALGGSARDDVKLDDAIWSRITQLEPPAREMAELVAMAGKPIPQEVAAAAAHIEPAEFNRRAATLRVSNLVRTGGVRWADAIEPYHDRVREAVLGRMEAGRKKALHEALAIAFEASSHGDPETLATHWREAGNAARAARYATAAGDEAQKTFAFDRAAQWYEQALGLIPDEPASLRDLRIKLGNALAFAGRGALAAPHFEMAAKQSPPMEALELRRRAADQLFRSGRVDDGFEASRAVLASIGLRFPRTRFETIVLLVFYRFLLVVRGLRFRQRERGQITAEELARVDTCTMLAYAFLIVDPLVGVAFQARAILLALRAGELQRVVRAISMEAVFSAFKGRRAWHRTERSLALARQLADRSGTVEARFFAASMRATALYCNGRDLEAVPDLQQGLDLIQNGSTGLVHEQQTGRVFLINSLASLGRFKELQRQQDEGFRQATARGDLYATVMMRVGFASFAWLVKDRPEVAEAQTQSAMAQWSRRGFHIPHYFGLLARVYAMLYHGRAAQADALATKLRRRSRASTQWGVQLARVRIFQLSAITALEMLACGLGDRAGLLRRAASEARAIEREAVPSHVPLAHLVRAGIALHTGKRDEAIRGLDSVACDFASLGMMAYAAATRDRAARLRDDASTAGEVERAAAFFRSEGVVAPERFIPMIVPGFLPREP
jgi:serine/threonine protein kinase